MNRYVRRMLVVSIAVLSIITFDAKNSILAQDTKTAISMRLSSMKGFGGHMKGISAYLKNGTGSAEDVAKRATEISATAKMLPSYFADKSEKDIVTDSKLRADAIIRANMTKFKSFATILSAEAAKLATIAKTGDKEAIAAQMGVIGKDACGACHGTFRSKSS